jgi:hypothetical protein
MRLRTCTDIFLINLILCFSSLGADSVSTPVPSKENNSIADIVSVLKSDSISKTESINGTDTASNAISQEYGSDQAFISMTGDCRYPAVSADGNTIHLAWIVTEGVNTSVYYRRSSDEGQKWTSSQKISNEHGDCHPPTIAVNAGIVHLAWVDYGETVDGELYYTRSLDSGNTWEKSRILITDANSSRYPLLACKDNDVYLIRQDVENKVYFKASYDKGLTWQEEMLLGKVGKHSCYCYPPAIASKDKELIIVWSDLGDNKNGLNLGVNGVNLLRSRDKTISSVVFRKSTDNGRTWNKPKVLSAISVSKETKEEIDNPVMLSDGSQYSVFWLDRRDVILGEIFYTRFDPKTAKFPIQGTKVYPISKRSPKRPSAVFDKDGNIQFTWASFFSNESVIYSGKIDPSGNPIGEKQNLTTTVGNYFNPVIARTASGSLHIFWFAVPKDENGWSRIFFKSSKDNGATWENWEPQKKDM